MKFDFNVTIWDLTKSIVVIALIIILFFKASDMLNGVTYNAERLIGKFNDSYFSYNNKADNKQLEDLIKYLESNKKSREKDLINKINKDNKGSGAEISEVIHTVATTKGHTDSEFSESKDSGLDDYGNYISKDVNNVAANGKQFPVGWVKYYKDNPDIDKWITGSYDLTYNLTLVQSEKKDGTFSTSTEMNVRSSETGDTQFPLDIQDVKWEKIEIKNKSWDLWNPRLGLGLIFSNLHMSPKFDISFISYGRTDVDMDWRFITVGLGAYRDKDDNWTLLSNFEPVSWNLGKIIPVVENLYIGPSITYDNNFNVSYGANISIPF